MNLHDWKYFLPHIYGVVTAKTVLDAIELNPGARETAPREIDHAIGTSRSESEVIARIEAILQSKVLSIAGSYGEYGYHIIQTGPGIFSVRDFFPERKTIERELDAEVRAARLRDTLEQVLERRLTVVPKGSLYASLIDGVQVATGETRFDAMYNALK